MPKYVVFDTRVLYLRRYALKGKKRKTRKELTVVEFLYYARFSQAISISIRHNNPTGKGITSSSITEEETEAWKDKITY